MSLNMPEDALGESRNSFLKPVPFTYFTLPSFFVVSLFLRLSDMPDEGPSRKERKQRPSMFAANTSNFGKGMHRRSGLRWAQNSRPSKLVHVEVH